MWKSTLKKSVSQHVFTKIEPRIYTKKLLFELQPEFGSRVVLWPPLRMSVFKLFPTPRKRVKGALRRSENFISKDEWSKAKLLKRNYIWDTVRHFTCVWLWTGMRIIFHIGNQLRSTERLEFWVTELFRSNSRMFLIK